MNLKYWLEISFAVQITLASLVVGTMIWRKLIGTFPFLFALLVSLLVWEPIQVFVMFHHHLLHLSRGVSWNIFYIGSFSYDAAFTLLQVLTIYSVFSEAMRPMTGLHEAGKIIFRWVGVVSLLVALGMISGPGMFTGMDGVSAIVSRLHQGIGVLTLCLLVFVGFATRPLGLTFRSHIFGVCLGLGIASTTNLAQAAWLVTKGASGPFSPVFLFDSVGLCVSLLVWGTYFALPEPKRRMILLPTTSPFFFWNRISEILGDAPGNVAVAGFSPDMLAEAEIEMLTAATSAERRDAEETVARPESQPAMTSLPSPSDFIPSRQPSLAL